ncbi:tetratricopeptide repeat protein [bacterium]|nr:tetratricopeptide repeat protein [bacterium]QQR57989.1 MAG: tetratricopeptide repeat protein [Candidatus Melainabacteria bacterium]
MTTKFSRLAFSILMALSLQITIDQNCAFAQESVSKALFEAGERALSLGQFKEAEKKLRLALKEAELAQSTDVEPILRKLVNALDAQGRTSDAILLQEKLCTLDKENKNITQLLVDLSSLASNLKEKDDFDAAMAKYNEALSALESKSLPKSFNKDEAKITLNLNLSGLYLEQANFDKAVASTKSALTLAEKLEQKDLKNKSQIECLDALGHIYIRQAGFDQAESCLQKALSLCDAKTQPRDKAHVILGLARSKFELGDFPNAEKLCMQTLEQDDTSFKIYAMYLLVDLKQAEGKLPDAIKILEKCQSMQEKVYGRESPVLAICLRKLAQALIDSNAYDRAESLLNRAIAIDKKDQANLNTAFDLNSLGMLYLRQGKYAQAEIPYKAALELAQSKSGQGHPDVAACLNNLAWLASNQNKLDEAQSLLERGLAIRLKTLGENHPAYARNLANIAKILIEKKNYTGAIENLEKALEIQRSALGAEHQDTVNSLSELAEVLYLSKNYTQAEENFRSLLEIDQKLEGEKSAKVAWDMEGLGKSLAAQNKTEEAKTLIASAKSIKASLPGFVADTNSGNPEESRGIYKENMPSQNLPLRPVSDKWALVVGVSNFKDSSINLQYAAKDATDFYNYLVHEAHFAPDHVKLLLDKNATRESIVSNLGEKWLAKEAGKDDLVVIYLSSHGTSSRKEIGDTNFIVAYETNLENVIFTGISMQSFTTGISDLIKSDRVVVVMDVCHGGAVRHNADLDNIATKSDAPPRIAMAQTSNMQNGMKGLIRSPEISGKSMGNMVGKGQIVLASSEADQVSWESTSYPNGVFTRRLIEGLRQKGEKTTVLEAFSYMRQKVEQEVLKDRSEIQTPIAVTKSWQGADVPLAIKCTNPKKP